MPKQLDSSIPIEMTQFDPLPTVMILFHMAQGYCTPSQGICNITITIDMPGLEQSLLEMEHLKHASP